MLHSKFLIGYSKLFKLARKSLTGPALEYVMVAITAFKVKHEAGVYSFMFPIASIKSPHELINLQLELLRKHEIDSIFFCADANGKLPTWRVELRKYEGNYHTNFEGNYHTNFEVSLDRAFISMTPNLNRLETYYYDKLSWHVPSYR